MQLFSNQSSYALDNAQRNLMGRTHYVDPDTLRFHKSKVKSSRHTDNGLLFAIVTSDAIDYQNRKRGFRYVIFNVFGTVIARTKLEDAYRTEQQATKAMWKALNEIDAKAITQTAIANAEKHFASEMATLRQEIGA
jgi:hypothetical protein